MQTPKNQGWTQRVNIKGINAKVACALVQEAKDRLNAINDSINRIEHKIYIFMAVDFSVLYSLLHTEKHIFIFSLALLAILSMALYYFFKGFSVGYRKGLPGTTPNIWGEKEITVKQGDESIVYAQMLDDYQQSIEISSKTYEAKRQWYRKGYHWSLLAFALVCLRILGDAYLSLA